MNERMFTTLYIAGTDSLRDPDNFRKALETASAERREKVSRLRSDAARASALGAELILRKALRDFGINAENLIYSYGEYGKPYFEGIRDFQFNISHSGDRVIAAVSDREIGCDIERITSFNPKIARRFFAPEEYEAIISGKGEQERGELFCRYWTLRESFLKVTGRGLSLPMDKFRFVTDSDGEIRVLQDLDQREYFFTEIAAESGYCCAVCQTGMRLVPEIIRTDIVSVIHFLAGNQS